jgi:hypothetical protein
MQSSAHSAWVVLPFAGRLLSSAVAARDGVAI